MVQDTLAIIQARRQTIKAEIEALKAEDTELAGALRTLERLASAKSQAPRALAAPAPTRPPAKRGRKPVSGDKSRSELILAVLAERGWLDVEGITSAIAKDYGVAVANRTISPLLSGLKRDGLIVRQGRKVALAAPQAPRRKPV